MAQHSLVDSISVPYDLVKWSESDEASELLDKLAKKSGALAIRSIAVRPGKANLEMVAETHDALRAAKTLLEMHLKFQMEYQVRKIQTDKMEQDLRATNEEFEKGQRIEFAVPEKLIGLVIGKGGANVNKVKEATGVDKIVVDTKTRSVRIRGVDAESVQKARALLEYQEIAITVPGESVASVMGEKGRNINDIWKKSGCVNLGFDEKPEGGESSSDTSSRVLRIVGIKKAVDLARDLVETQLEFDDMMKSLAKDEVKIKKQLNTIDSKFREFPSERPAATHTPAPNFYNGYTVASPGVVSKRDSSMSNSTRTARNDSADSKDMKPRAQQVRQNNAQIPEKKTQSQVPAPAPAPPAPSASASPAVQRTKRATNGPSTPAAPPPAMAPAPTSAEPQRQNNRQRKSQDANALHEQGSVSQTPSKGDQNKPDGKPPAPASSSKKAAGNKRAGGAQQGQQPNPEKPAEVPPSPAQSPAPQKPKKAASGEAAATSTPIPADSGVASTRTTQPAQQSQGKQAKKAPQANSGAQNPVPAAPELSQAPQSLVDNSATSAQKSAGGSKKTATTPHADKQVRKQTQAENTKPNVTPAPAATAQATSDKPNRAPTNGKPRNPPQSKAKQESAPVAQ